MVQIFILDAIEKSLEYQWIPIFRPYKIIGVSSSQGGDSGAVAGQIVSKCVCDSSIRSLICNPKVGIAFGLLAEPSE